VAYQDELARLLQGQYRAPRNVLTGDEEELSQFLPESDVQGAQQGIAESGRGLNRPYFIPSREELQQTGFQQLRKRLGLAAMQQAAEERKVALPERTKGEYSLAAGRQQGESAQRVAEIQGRSGVSQEEAKTRGMLDVEGERMKRLKDFLQPSGGAAGGGATGGFRPSVNAQGQVSLAPPQRLLGRSQEMIAGADSSAHSLDKLEALLPAVEGRLGPLTGRLSALGLQIPGISVDKNFAAFSAETATLTNATIKAVTGAQMSEPEANRIRKQIPALSDKPDVWRAKAAATRDNLRFLRQRMVDLGAGETGVDESSNLGDWEQVGQ